MYRVHPEGTLSSLREEVDSQLGPESVPRDYIFLRSVGRCLTKVLCYSFLSKGHLTLSQKVPKFHFFVILTNFECLLLI